MGGGISSVTDRDHNMDWGVDKFNEITDAVYGWITELPPDAVDVFRTCERNKLSRYHMTLGTKIRDDFKLWSYQWVPELIDGVDYSMFHPDNIAMSIIEYVWDRLNSEHG